jgi:hypothetical protein
MSLKKNLNIRTKFPSTMNVLLVAAGSSGNTDTLGVGGQVIGTEVTVEVGKNYNIVIGSGGVDAAGGDTRAFGITALGGSRDGITGFSGNGIEGVLSNISGSSLFYGMDGSPTSTSTVDETGSGGSFSERGRHGIVIISYPSTYLAASILGEFTLNNDNNMRIYTITANSTFLF